ncbi:MAG: hypothetical protein AAGA56_15800, partial [Myxococcota bacterium]
MIASPSREPTDLHAPDLLNPLVQHQFARHGASHGPEVDRLFMAGDYRAFPLWAELVSHGYSRGRPRAGLDSPHQRVWSSLAGRSSTVRRPLLRTLVLARQRHQARAAGPFGQPRQLDLPPCRDHCRRFLASYLKAFRRPTLTLEPARALGDSVTSHAHYPEATMVELAGAYGVLEALDAIETLLRVPRRFYSLHSDHGTEPVEVSQSFSAAMVASLAFARRSERGHKLVGEMFARLMRDVDGIDVTYWETAWSLDEEPHRPAEVKRLEADDRAASGLVDPRLWSKRPWFEQARRALASKPFLFPGQTHQPRRVPGSVWEVALNLSDAIEGRAHAASISRDVLFYTTAMGRWGAIDLRTGRRRFELPLHARQGWAAAEVDRMWVEEPVVWTRLELFHASKTIRTPMLIGFDHESGWVVHAEPADSARGGRLPGRHRWGREQLEAAKGLEVPNGTRELMVKGDNAYCLTDDALWVVSRTG